MPATLAFPDDDPHGVRHGYERDGLDTLRGALSATGPIAPVPPVTPHMAHLSDADYHALVAEEHDAGRRRHNLHAAAVSAWNRQRAADAEVRVILSPAYLDYLLGTRATRPTTADLAA